MNRKASCVLLLLLPLFAVSCNPAPRSTVSVSPEGKASTALALSEGVKLDIGDVDSQVYVETQLAPEAVLRRPFRSGQSAIASEPSCIPSVSLFGEATEPQSR